MRRLAGLVEIWLVAAILSFSCVTQVYRPDPASWPAEVVAVQTSVGPTGEPICRVTVAWQHGDTFEQATITTPFGSRWSMLRTGQHVRMQGDALEFYRIVGTD